MVMEEIKEQENEDAMPSSKPRSAVIGNNV
jgi:hypothetical protein